MTRIFSQEEYALSNVVNNLKKDIISIKLAQKFGADSVKTKATMASGGNDIAGGSVQPYQIKKWRVIFSPLAGQTPEPYVEVMANWSLGNANGYETVLFYPDPRNSLGYILAVYADSSSVSVTAKFAAKSTHFGSFEVSAI